MSDVQGFITVEHAAALTGFSAPYVRKLAREEVIEAQRWVSVWMISKASLLAYKERMDALGTQKHGRRETDNDEVSPAG